MSALAVIRDLLQKKADWRAHCLACEGAPEVYIAGNNLQFYFCKPCVKKYIDALLEGRYCIFAAEPDELSAGVYLAEKKMR